ncbi:hypothetical protein AVEN_84831-1 [Araneus ventricosus]|uniref:Peptidase A2 domain-containing protein n=1 Tax=Araneus ventricosus TaxID=182803 RepID=A0A4Y2IXL6_ARAVE|nr:hypothetical protein AVEN_84831-1 [Araneus ventricosus]
MTATGDLQKFDRLLITDRKSDLRFSVDSGASISFVPAKIYRGRRGSNFMLSAANSTRIRTYGELHLNINIGLRRIFPFAFIIANVSHPILGMDFLTKYALILDFKKKLLTDSLTSLQAVGTPSR